jgi:rhamnose utilization protein RhaD (predicted bifunctional aldolase and dehydrogenase)
MENIAPSDFVQVGFAPVLDLLDNPPATVSAMNERIAGARLNPDDPRPSVEVSFHALLLHECRVAFIAHTHPVAVNQILCSNRASDFAYQRLFPDEVVLCGVESVFVPYVDPGLPLALALRERVRPFMDKHGEAPKVILLQNHGFIALAQTAREALNITAMGVKAAQIFAGACAVGEPVFMPREEVYHIYKRPDEIYRRQQFVTG